MYRSRVTSDRGNRRTQPQTGAASLRYYYTFFCQRDKRSPQKQWLILILICILLNGLPFMSFTAHSFSDSRRNGKHIVNATVSFHAFVTLRDTKTSHLLMEYTIEGNSFDKMIWYFGDFGHQWSWIFGLFMLKSLPIFSWKLQIISNLFYPHPKTKQNPAHFWAGLLAPQEGLEPTTLRLTAECSAIELLRNIYIYILSKNFVL